MMDKESRIANMLRLLDAASDQLSSALSIAHRTGQTETDVVYAAEKACRDAIASLKSLATKGGCHG